MVINEFCATLMDVVLKVRTVLDISRHMQDVNSVTKVFLL